MSQQRITFSFAMGFTVPADFEDLTAEQRAAVARLAAVCQELAAAIDAGVRVTGDFSHLVDVLDPVESLLNVFKRARACNGG